MAVDESRDDLSAPPGGWPLPRAAYIHIPFCRHRCGYCNFSVLSGRDELADRFLSALDVELARLDRPAVDTLFIGGGTPTHLNPVQLRRLLDQVRNRFDLTSAGEWSVEANPEDIDSVKLDLLADAGVNRISLGVQSFAAPKLELLERGHRGEAATAAIRHAASALGNVSIDLIFASPGESLDQWRRDLETSLALPISHLSTYALTFEKGTSFWSRLRRGELHQSGDDLEVEMYNLTRKLAGDAGMSHYEVSNFSRPEARCRHNLAYWRGRGWFAAGPGAARFSGGRREVNHRSTTTYLKRIESGADPTAESETIDRWQYARERAAFGIRMTEGIDLGLVGQEAGVDLLAACETSVAKAVEHGWVEQRSGHVKLTEAGILFADSVAAGFLG